MRWSGLVWIGILSGLAAVAQAATVTYDLVPVTPLTGTEVVVQPGQTVDYALVVTVTSDTAEADNHGLSVFQVQIDSNAGVTQMPLDSLDPVVVANFTIGQSVGIVAGDHITNVGAGQLGLVGVGAPLFQGVGVGQASVLGRGRFNTPTTETTFTPKVNGTAGALTASVVGAGSQDLRSVPAAHILVGPGFTIRTSTTAGTDTGGGSTSDSGTSSQTLSPGTQALVAGGAALLVMIGAYMLFGPLGLGIGLVVGPLLGLLLLMMGL